MCFSQWLLWMERKDANMTSSWESWWIDEHSHLGTKSWAKKLCILTPMVRAARPPFMAIF